MPNILAQLAQAAGAKQAPAGMPLWQTPDNQPYITPARPSGFFPNQMNFGNSAFMNALAKMAAPPQSAPGTTPSSGGMGSTGAIGAGGTSGNAMYSSITPNMLNILMMLWQATGQGGQGGYGGGWGSMFGNPGVNQIMGGGNDGGH